MLRFRKLKNTAPAVFFNLKECAIYDKIHSRKARKGDFNEKNYKQN